MKIKDLAHKSRQRRITAIFALSVFLILVGTMFLVGVAGYILMATDVMHIEISALSDWSIWLIFILSSIFLGTILSYLMARYVTRAVNDVARGMSRLAAGEFDVRINVGKSEEAQKLNDAFNTLAKELQSIQLLRSDFVNEFAHEFKTPIVSIRGFAELLSKSNLSEEQKKEYVSVILEESVRLSTLAENSLSLSRVESLNILTGVTEYNVSEQIRACLLLLENKWSAKNLDLKVDFNEFAVNANEELLKQVWINLLDNAIKFSKDGGVIEINLKMENNKLSVSIINEGIEISEYDKTKIFDKFYRSEKSKFIEGSGVGLAIVKKIVSLHGGEIAVNSIDGKTCFTVTLKSAKVI